eukprot:7380686-Prymnesium_polylepis.1
MCPRERCWVLGVPSAQGRVDTRGRRIDEKNLSVTVSRVIRFDLHILAGPGRKKRLAGSASGTRTAHAIRPLPHAPAPWGCLRNRDPRYSILEMHTYRGAPITA